MWVGVGRAAQRAQPCACIERASQPRLYSTTMGGKERGKRTSPHRTRYANIHAPMSRSSIDARDICCALPDDGMAEFKARRALKARFARQACVNGSGSGNRNRNRNRNFGPLASRRAAGQTACVFLPQKTPSAPLPSSGVIPPAVEVQVWQLSRPVPSHRRAAGDRGTASARQMDPSEGGVGCRLALLCSALLWKGPGPEPPTTLWPWEPDPRMQLTPSPSPSHSLSYTHTWEPGSAVSLWQPRPQHFDPIAADGHSSAPPTGTSSSAPAP